jgi:hypothetical protein
MKRTFSTSSILALLSLTACGLPDQNLGEIEIQGDTEGGESGTTSGVTSDDPSATGPHEGTTSADSGPVLECEDYEPPFPCALDADGDSIPLACDNAPEVFNPTQVDADSDGVADVLDLCPSVPGEASNAADSDADGIGNACDSCPSTVQHYNELAQGIGLPARALVRNIPDVGDIDGDGVGDACDNCVTVPNCDDYSSADPWKPGDEIGRDDPSTCQRDDDGDMIGDACVGMQLAGAAGPVGFGDADDFDQDGLANAIDGCVRLPLAETIACDDDGDCDDGARCEVAAGICGHVDIDGDLVGDVCDTCASSPNADQLLDGDEQEDDEDGDFVGRACETASCDSRNDPAPMAFYTESAAGKCCTTLLVESEGDLFYVDGGRPVLDPDGLPVRVDCEYDDFELRTCSRLPEAVAAAPGVLTLPPGCSGASEIVDVADIDDALVYWSYRCELPQRDQDYDGIGDVCDLCPFSFDPDNTPYVDDAGKVWENDGKYCNGAYSLENVCDE